MSARDRLEAVCEVAEILAARDETSAEATAERLREVLGDSEGWSAALASALLRPRASSSEDAAEMVEGAISLAERRATDTADWVAAEGARPTGALDDLCLPAWLREIAYRAYWARISLDGDEVQS